MLSIVKVEIYLDDNVPECMDGIIRCGSVISYDKNNTKLDHQDLIDNTEYYSEDELVKDIAERLKVNKSIIKIMR